MYNYENINLSHFQNKDLIVAVKGKTNRITDDTAQKPTRHMPTRPTENSAPANSAHVYKTTRSKFIRQLCPYIFEVHTSCILMHNATRMSVH